jgi:tetratricopeptide (TPR) repeat protein
MAKDQETLWRRWTTPLAALVLIAAGAAAYSNSLAGPFVFDDVRSIVSNPSLRNLARLDEVLVPPPEAVTVTGRPVANLTFALNYRLGGEDVRGYHLVNLAVHLLAGLTLFGAARRALLLPAWRERFGHAATGLALAVALVWMLHPLQTESVTYIVQRTESLAGLFYLVTFYAVVRAIGSERPGVWHATAIVACALGMATKETAVSAPLVMLLFERVATRRPLKEVLRCRWPLYAGLAATWVLLAAVMATSWNRYQTAGFGLGMDWFDYACTQFGNIVHYLRLSFWPHPLVIDYGAPLATTAGQIVPSAAVVALLVAATAVAWWRWPGIGWLGVWFFATLAPSSSIVPLVNQTAAEHRMYLALAAVVALVILGGYAAWQRLAARGGETASPPGRAWRAAAVVLVLAMAGALGATTYVRNIDYQSPLALWRTTAAHCPDSFRAQLNLGAALSDTGDYAGAMQAHNNALRLQPHSEKAYYNRGMTYRLTGQLKESIDDFTRAVRLRIDYPQAWFNRGNDFRDLGRYEEAVRDYSMAIGFDPSYADSCQNRALCYYHLRRYDEAWADIARVEALGGTPSPELTANLTAVSGRPR